MDDFTQATRGSYGENIQAIIAERDRLRARVAELETGGWISVEDRLPRKGDTALVLFNDSRTPQGKNNMAVCGLGTLADDQDSPEG